MRRTVIALEIVYWVLVVAGVWMAMDPMWEPRLYRTTYRVLQWTAFQLGRMGLQAENMYRETLEA